MRPPTVVASAFNALASFAIARGADAAALAQRTGVPLSPAPDPNGRIPVERYVALLDAAVELCHDPALALAYGEQVSTGDLSILALVASNVDTLQAGHEKVNRYAALLLDDGEDHADPLRLTQRDGKIWLTLTSRLYTQYPLLTESALARVITDARRMFQGHAAFQAGLRFPDALHFTYPEPAHRQVYDRVFGVPLVFDSRVNAIVVDARIMSFVMPKQYGAAAELLSTHADAMLADLRASSSTRSAVEKALLANLPTGDVRMATIARQLSLSRSTLFRRLKAEGVVFDDVLATLRHRRAVTMLTREQHSVQQTARLLGFSDTAAFSRAFKRWTGKSPRQMRTQSGDAT